MTRGGEDDAPAEPRRQRSHFNLAAPRNFLYPAILLLLGEEPRHGYRLLDALLSLGFGPVDRASVYRALSEMEEDQFLDSWRAPATAGSPRHVYGLSDAGMVALRGWMDVVAEEHDALEAVLKRFDVMLGEDS
ncbi:MAG: helix-turn-helix transcriptional regulator [Actinomycetota bacterium]|nr:helix-turn-helix transcriptional regulator [Actinomycetota bacterium]